MTEVQELLDGADAWGLADAIRSGAVTAHDVLDETHRRVEERNDAVNAVVESCFDAARAELDLGGPDRRLAGVPFVVKALGQKVAGMRTTNGSALWRDDIADEDSELVARYRRAGLVIVGLTNSPELGKNASTEPTHHGPTRNPRRLTHSVGGSSGGTAAAMAAGMVVIGHGNDGGGSIRIPASMNGLVGLKPSRGRTTAAPNFNLLSYPLGINHVITRSVRDSALLLDLTAGSMPGDPYVIAPPARPYVDELGTEVAPRRIAWSTVTPKGDDVHPDCARATAQAADLLRGLGHTVVPATPPWPLADLAEVMSTVMGVVSLGQIQDRLASLGRDLAEDDLEPFTRVLLGRSEAATAVEFMRSLQAVERAGRALGPFFEDFDLLLTPTLAEPVPPLGHLDTRVPATMYQRAGLFSALTGPFNVTGQPAISLPLGTDSSGLPIGVQLVARFGAEDLLIAVSSQIEQVAGWKTGAVWPPTP